MPRKRVIRHVVGPIFILSFLITAATAAAQRVELGLVGGATRSIIEAQTATFPRYGFERETSPGGGIAVTVPFSWWLSMRAEALLVTRRTTVPEAFRLRARYLEWPLLVRVHTPDVEGARLFASGGMAFAKESRCDAWAVSTAPSTGAPHPEVEVECRDYRSRSNDRGRVLGAGIRWERAQSAVEAEWRSIRGMENLQEPQRTIDWRWRSTMLMLGASWRLGGS